MQGGNRNRSGGSTSTRLMEPESAEPGSVRQSHGCVLALPPISPIQNRKACGRDGLCDHMLSEARVAGRDAFPQAFTFSNRSEEHTSELQSLMRISYAVFCLTKNNNN